MSQEVLLVLIPALIALAGTLLTVYVGVRQYRQQTSQKSHEPFTADQQAAYKGLWDALEEVHIQLRTDKSALIKYNVALSQVNTFLMKNALYLDRTDQTLSNQYLASLKQITEIVNKYHESMPQLASDWSKTSQDLFTGDSMRAFTDAEQAVIKEMEATRQKILEKCRRVLKGL